MEGENKLYRMSRNSKGIPRYCSGQDKHISQYEHGSPMLSFPSICLYLGVDVATELGGVMRAKARRGKSEESFRFLSPECGLEMD
ncbi:hypothetical protein J6590_053895 [Homalodisca vitripennis]|nr:hypothetical protein J6590_053895 [Homalodisca vitripennis]